MPKGSNNLGEFLTFSGVLIENARNIPEIKEALEKLGYTTDVMANGAKLLSDVLALVQKQSKEYGESYEATQLLDAARDKADLVYIKTLKLARLVFGEDPNVSAQLKLYGPRKQSIAGWLDQAGTFYANLISNSGFIAKMARFGYSAKSLSEEAALVEDVKRKLEAQIKESAEAVSATQERDRKVAELDTWVSELRAVAKIAFWDNPQQLEKIGILIRSTPKPKKAPEKK